MVSVSFINDIFRPQEVKRVNQFKPGKDIWGYLKEVFGENFIEFDSPTICIKNGKPILREDWGKRCKTGDAISFVPVPGDPVTALIVIASVIVGAVAFSLLLPDTPEVYDQESEDTYSLRGQTNQARLNEPIEVVYGKPHYYPSLAETGFTVYEGNEQYLYQLFMVGNGNFDTAGATVRIGDTLFDNFDGTSKNFLKGDGTFTLYPAGGVETNVTAANIQLLAPNEVGYPGFSGPWTMNAAGTTAKQLQIDIVFPRGLYKLTDKGELDSVSVTIDPEYRELDQAGSPVGGWVDLSNQTITAASNTPVRKSFKYTIPVTRYELRIVRTNNSALSTKTVEDAYLESAKTYLDDPVDYGNVTLLETKVKATNNLNSRSRNRLNLKIERKLRKWNKTNQDWDAEAATRSIVWAFVDLFTASYAGNLDQNKLDLDALYDLDATYTTRGDTFDYVFTRKSTVWQMAKIIATAGRAIPVIQGNKITMVFDGVATVPTALFNKENINKGSFKWAMRLPKPNQNDGLEVQYYDETNERQELLPILLDNDRGIDPERIQLPGVTNRQQAYDWGNYYRAKQKYLKDSFSFDVTSEGHIPAIGDLVAFEHPTPKYGKSGVIEDIRDGRKFTLKPLFPQNTKVVGNYAEKTSGGSSWDNSGAFTTQQYNDGCRVICQPVYATETLMFGLSETPASETHYRRIDHAFYCRNDGALQVFENGTFVSNEGTYAVNDLLEVIYDGEDVVYKKNDVEVQRTSSLGSRRTYGAAVAFNTEGAAAWLDFMPHHCQLIDVSTGGTMNLEGNKATCTNAGAAGWQTGAYSRQGISGGCYVSGRCSTDGAGGDRAMLGLTTEHPDDADGNWIDFNYAVYFDQAGTYEGRELSASVSLGGVSVDSNIKVAIVYDGIDTVKYYVRGDLKRTVTGVGAGKTFYLGTSFDEANTTLTDLEFGPLSEFNPVVDRSDMVYSPDINDFYVYGGIRRLYRDLDTHGTAWGSTGVYSRQKWSGGAFVEFQIKDLDSNSNLAIGLNQDQTTDNNYTSIDYAFLIKPAGTAWEIVESGTSRGTVDGTATHDENSVFRIEYDTNGLIRYLVNGQIIRAIAASSGLAYGFDAAFKQSSAASIFNINYGPLHVTELQLSDPVYFGDRTGWVYEGTSNPITEKPDGYEYSSQTQINATTWTALAYTKKSYTGGCRIGGKPDTVSRWQSIGIDEDPAASQFGQFDYSIYCHSTLSQIDIRQGFTTLKSITGLTATPIEWVELIYDDTEDEIRFYVNNVLEHTITGITSGKTYYGALNAGNAGYEWFGVQFGPKDFYISARDDRGALVGPLQVHPVQWDRVRDPYRVQTEEPVDSETLTVQDNKLKPWYSFGGLDNWARYGKVGMLSPASNHDVNVAITPYDSRVYDKDGLTPPAIGDPGHVPAEPARPEVKKVYVEHHPTSFNTMVASWPPAFGADEYFVELEYVTDGITIELGRTKNTFITFETTQVTNAKVHVYGIGDELGPPATWTGEIGRPKIEPANITSLNVINSVGRVPAASDLRINGSVISTGLYQGMTYMLKDSGTSQWDNSISSERKLDSVETAGAYLHCVIGEGAGTISAMIGFQESIADFGDETLLDYSFYVSANDNLYCREDNVNVATVTPAGGMQSTTRLEILYAYSTIHYFVDGARVRSVSVGTAKTFYFEAFCYHVSTKRNLEQIYFGSDVPSFKGLKLHPGGTNGAVYAYSAQTADSFNREPTTSSTNILYSVSKERYTGGAYCQARFKNNDDESRFGLSTAGLSLATSNRMGIWETDGAGNVLAYVRGNATAVYTHASHVAADVFRIEYDGTETRFYSNGTLRHTETGDPAGEVVNFCAQLETQDTEILEIEFGPPQGDSYGGIIDFNGSQVRFKWDEAFLAETYTYFAEIYDDNYAFWRTVLSKTVTTPEGFFTADELREVSGANNLRVFRIGVYATNSVGNSETSYVVVSNRRPAAITDYVSEFLGEDAENDYDVYRIRWNDGPDTEKDVEDFKAYIPVAGAASTDDFEKCAPSVTDVNDRQYYVSFPRGLSQTWYCSVVQLDKWDYEQIWGNYGKREWITNMRNHDNYKTVTVPNVAAGGGEPSSEDDVYKWRRP